MSLLEPYRPVPMADIEAALPASVGHLMPAQDDIPQEFWRGTGDARRWVQFQQDWFFRGFPRGTKFVAKPGVDLTLALRHLTAIQRSWEPKHEYKEAAVAFLASLWLVEPPRGVR